MTMLHTLAHQSSMQEIDLLNPVLDPRITFSRASTKTYFGSDGLLHTADADEWPLEYDPITLKPVGRSVWEQRTNLCTRSQQSGVSRFGITETDNAAVAPDGTTTMVLQTNDGNSGQHWKQVAALWPAAAAAATYSIYIKKGTANFVHFFNASTSTYAQFDLTTGALVFSSAGTMTGFSAALKETLPGGFFRFVVTGTSTSGATGNMRLYFLNASQNTAAPTEVSSATGYWWGEQMEQAAFASPYIPTAGSQVTRVADSVDVLNLAALRYNSAEYALYASGVSPGGIQQKTMASLSFGTSTSNRAIIYLTATLCNAQVRNNNDVMAQLSVSLLGATDIRSAMRVKQDSFAVTFDGAPVVEDTAGIVPAAGDRLQIGTNTSANYFNGLLRSIKLYPAGLSNSELQALAA